MKLLFVTSCFPSNSLPQFGIFLYQLAKKLQMSGHEVDILDLDSSNDFIEYYDNFKIINKKNFANRIQVSLGLNNKENIQSFNSFFDLYYYDFVIIHFANYSSINSLLTVLKQRKIKSVYYLHALNAFKDIHAKHKFLNLLLGVQKKHFFRKVDHFVCVSELTKKVLLKKMPKANARVIYNGVDNEMFKPAAQEKQINQFKTISIGNLFKLKGHKYLINAVYILKEKYGINVELDIYGRGIEENQLLKQIHKLKLEDLVHLKGYVPYDVISKEMSNYSIFALPSYFEAFGCVFLESMSSGLISVGCKYQGNAEFMSNNIDSFLAEPRSTKSIVKIYLKIKESNDLNVIRKNAREKSLQYSWDRSCEALINLLNEIQIC